MAKRDQRRLELINATISVVAAHGYSETTVSRVAKEAGLSLGLMHFYFKSKDHLFEETLRHLTDEYDLVWQAALQEFDGNAPRRLVGMIYAFFDKQVFSQDRLAVWFAFWADAKLRDRFRQDVVKTEQRYSRAITQTVREIGKAAKFDRAHADLIGTSLISMIDGFWLQYMINPQPATRGKAIANCLSFLRLTLPDLSSVWDSEAKSIAQKLARKKA
ncbi:MAG TPA: transcriptional regulator BetI [Dongiaceae bacterium]